MPSCNISRAAAPCAPGVSSLSGDASPPPTASGAEGRCRYGRDLAAAWSGASGFDRCRAAVCRRDRLRTVRVRCGDRRVPRDAGVRATAGVRGCALGAGLDAGWTAWAGAGGVLGRGAGANGAASGLGPRKRGAGSGRGPCAWPGAAPSAITPPRHTTNGAHRPASLKPMRRNRKRAASELVDVTLPSYLRGRPRSTSAEPGWRRRHRVRSSPPCRPSPSSGVRPRE
jgi:hypothetical protein